MSVHLATMWRVFLITAVALVRGQEKRCVPYTVDNEVLACVCNATYCDSTLNLQSLSLKSNNFYQYETNKQGLRMELSEGTLGASNLPSNATLKIDTGKQYQKIFGFGGAFTDSTGINLARLSRRTQEQVLKAYYDPIHGSNYNIGRFPIGGTDFSVRPYTYDDVANDASLKNFALALEDHKYKIPYAHRARKINPTTKFFASAWSAPGWMKTNGVFEKFGYLKKEYYQVWANYLAKFVDAYKAHGLEMWTITTGNEPTVAFHINISHWITMGWTPDTMADWVANNLGPTLAKSTSKKTRILVVDDYRDTLPRWIEPMYNNSESSKYCLGTAVHWYFDTETPVKVLDETRDVDPSKIIIMTEASGGPTYWGRQTIVTDIWALGERYILSIIEYVNHWAVGWVDWNLVLDKDGGPTWMNNTLNAPIVINPQTDEFYKLSMYYAIAHFSKFVRRDSVRVSITDTDDVKSAAFVTPSEEVVVILYNKNPNSITVTLQDKIRGDIQVELSPLSMNTVIYKL